MKKIKYPKELLIIFSVLVLHLLFGLWISKDLLFFYSRVEFAWKMFHEGFLKNLFADFTPPGYYVIPGFLAQLTHLSIGFWQKFIDLLCGDLIIAFVSIHSLYKRNIYWLYPLFLGVFSFGLILPLTLQGGEAVVALPVIVGLWFLSQKKYVPFGLLFAISIWFKFLSIFVSPVVIAVLLYRYFNSEAERRPILISSAIVILSFCTYLFLDQAIGIHFQINRPKAINFNFSLFDNLDAFIHNFAFYSLIVFLSLPFAFFVKKLFPINIYTASALPTLVAITIFGVGPYYVYPVIALIYAGIFMSKKITIPPAALFFSIFFSVIIMQINPAVSLLHSQNQTKQEREWLISEISKDYRGGVIVIPFNFALEFPFRHYLLDGLPSSSEDLSQIEYLLTPNGQIPAQLSRKCKFTYYSRLSDLVLFKAECNQL